MSDKPVLVASDVHLTPESRDRAEPFLQWLAWAGDHASRIILNGDVFDFWYEYGSVIPRGHTRLLGLLAEITDSGVPVDFMGGNHDWWVGDYFTGELGVTVHRDPVVLDLGGFRTLLAHGDGLGSGDLGYRFLKLLLRGRATRWAFRRLHPDWGTWIARKVSMTETRTEEPHEAHVSRARFLERWAREALAEDPDLDLVILGHTHIPALVEVEPGRWYANAGDWIHRRSFLELGPDGEGPRLLQWSQGAPVSLRAPDTGD